MPNRDRTGPQDLGPLTGREMGICVDGIPRGRGFGRGLGAGRGFGRGYGRFGPRFRRFSVIDSEPLARTEEKSFQFLKEDLKELEAEIREIGKRLEELD